MSRSFFPVILQALRQTPVIGTFLSLPYIRGVSMIRSLISKLTSRPLTSLLVYGKVLSSRSPHNSRTINMHNMTNLERGPWICRMVDRHSGQTVLNHWESTARTLKPTAQVNVNRWSNSKSSPLQANEAPSVLDANSAFSYKYRGYLSIV